MAAKNLFGNTRCGCITCHDGILDDDRSLSRQFWKSKTNKKHHGYGRTKPTGKKIRRTTRLNLP